MKTWLIVAAFTLAINSPGQNLLPNASFELAERCPTGLSKFKNNVQSWFSPNRATPDLFSTCGKGLYANASRNIFATTELIAGNNYAGIIVYQAGVKNYREYIAVNLDTCLEKGEEYRFSMFVRISENQPFAVDELQVQFSNSFKFQKDTYCYTETSGKTFSITIPNIDTARWIELAMTFTADGTERMLMIGNFKSDSEFERKNNKSFGKSIGQKAVYAYYLIDSVSLYKNEITDEGVRDQRFNEQGKKGVKNQKKYGQHYTLHGTTDELSTRRFENSAGHLGTRFTAMIEKQRLNLQHLFDKRHH